MFLSFYFVLVLLIVVSGLPLAIKDLDFGTRITDEHTFKAPWAVYDAHDAVHDLWRHMIDHMLYHEIHSAEHEDNLAKPTCTYCNHQ